MKMKAKEDKYDKDARSEAGRLGAYALNSDPEKKSAATKKAALTRKKINPNIFREMGHMGGSSTKAKSKGDKK